MPRKKKPTGPSTQGGYGAQPIREPTGQPYGDRQASVDSQRAMRLPEVPGPSAPGPAGGAPASAAAGGAPAGPAGPEQPQDRLEAAMQAALKMRAPDPLMGPTKRPSEPLTTGMSIGPGGGPEMLRTGDRVTKTFRLLASISGDARFSELAELAAMRGK